MQENLKNILSNLSTDIDQEILLQYLQDQLTEEKKHELEKQLLENEFANDAMEGLQQLKNKKDIHIIIDHLNRELKIKTAKKNLRRDRLKLQARRGGAQLGERPACGAAWGGASAGGHEAHRACRLPQATTLASRSA